MRLVLAILAVTAPCALAQMAPPSTPVPNCIAPPTAFDTASVRPSQLDSRSSHSRGTADSISSSGSVFLILQNAYDLRDFQVIGGPEWVRTATWDIIAKVDEPTPNYTSLPNAARGAIQRQRIQAVLAQRFNLKCHFEVKELPVYNLIVSKGGSKLTTTPADSRAKGSLDAEVKGHDNVVRGQGVELDTLARMLFYSAGRSRMVIDKTGLAGLYDFTLSYATDSDADSSEASGPSIFTALEEQLGFKLEPSKGPVPVLVIDSIDRPSEN
jgi:uncharacterized protein (TIGR03435 family)